MIGTMKTKGSYSCLINFWILSQFLFSVRILYYLKTPENQESPGVDRGYKMRTLARNGLRCIVCSIQHKHCMLCVESRYDKMKIYLTWKHSLTHASKKISNILFPTIYSTISNFLVLDERFSGRNMSKFCFNDLNFFLVSLSVLVTLLQSAGPLQFGRWVVKVMQKLMDEWFRK